MGIPAIAPAASGVWSRGVDGIAALCASLMLVAYHAVRGFPSLADSGGDNDSVFRLVQVRDLLGGQGWFDLTQYRMGFDGGFVMHWSRLVDLPIALLASAFGEVAALIIWPALLFGLAVYLIARTAAALGGDETRLPAIVLGGLALFFVNVFRPGALDHHNVQLVLALATLFFLVRGRKSAAKAALAGICAALMLAIGMEAAPYVAVACAIAALSFLAGGAPNVSLARAFGAGFAATGVLVVAATIPVSDWLAVHCDAYSVPQASLAILGGGGLCLIASAPAAGGSLVVRLGALVLLGALCAGVVLAAFPQCLAAPYADLDPRFQSLFIDEITEAQSIADIARNAPAQLAIYYATPLLALAVLGWTAIRAGWNRDRAILAGFLVAALLVSFWQVRGSTFAIVFATIPLALWVASARRHAQEDPRPVAQLAMLCTWLVSVNLAWQLAAVILSPAASEAAAGNADAAQCYAHADYAALATLPAGTVAAISNMGSTILANTPHRVLSGPYHRNGAAILANLDLMMTPVPQARAMARTLGIDYVALCPGNAETDLIAQWAPQGLLAALLSGNAPSWLSPEPAPDGQPVLVWRFARDG